MAKPTSQQVKDFIHRVESLGGSVTRTRRDHLRVVGPAGIAFVSSQWRRPNDRKNAYADVRRCAGLDLLSPGG